MDPQSKLTYTPAVQQALSQIDSEAPSSQPSKKLSYTPAVQQALSQIQGNEPAPQDVQTADSQQGRQDLNGWCESAVEQWAGLPKMGTTAKDAWNNFVSQKKAYSGLQGIQPGDLVYYDAAPGNHNEGHVGLFENYDSQGNPIMISAT